jgi:DNA-binding NarL/FixJ family response regulator
VGSAREALDRFASAPPDVAIIDYRMPGMDGLELLETLRADGHAAPIVVLSADRDHNTVKRCLSAGARGFVAKESHIDVLLAALEAVMAGRSFVDPVVAADVLQGAEELLTPREAEVIALVSDGLQNKEIARALIVSEETVKSHVSSIMHKLDAASRTHAVGIAFRSGIVR